MAYSTKSPKETFNDLIVIDNNNSGLTTTTKDIVCGSGAKSCLKLGDDNLIIQPQVDDTTILDVKNQAGDIVFRIDLSTTHPSILSGTSQVPVTTCFKEFGMYDFSPITFTHHSLNATYTGDLAGSSSQTPLAFGTGTNPATSYTISSDAKILVKSAWIMTNGIVLDEVRIIVAADSSTTANFHLMSFNYSTSGADAGDLSSGDVHASSGGEGSLSPITIGDDRAVTSILTLDNANIDSNKAILAFVENASGSQDITCSMQIQYHFR